MSAEIKARSEDVFDRPIGFRKRPLDPMVENAGYKNSLHFQIDWRVDGLVPKGLALPGRLTLGAGDRYLWGNEADGVLLDFRRVIKHLSEQWFALTSFETFPLGVQPQNPSGLRESLRILANEEPALSSTIDQEFAKFRAVHDLGHAWLDGARLLWLVREGSLIVLDDSHHPCRLPVEDIIWVLSELGDAIARRALAVGTLAGLTERWARRAEASKLREVFARSLDIRSQSLQRLLRSGRIQIPPSVKNLLTGRDPARLAARMIGDKLPINDVEAVLDGIARMPKVDAPKLETLTPAALAVMDDFSGEDPYVQGYELARWLRSELGLPADQGNVDPESLVRSWGVSVINQSLHHSIDALSCWGSEHGPGIIINPQGLRSQEAGGKRATAAHEICHLLVDRAKSLPAVEILSGRPFRVPRIAERRANAFAAEFLVPREGAVHEYRRSTGPDDAVRHPNLRG
jgi:Zn-dependent peptidase ImmA (M78 family)